MKLEVGNLNTLVSEATEDEWYWLHSFLAFDDPSSRFRDGGRGKAEPKPIQLLDRKHNIFPSGLIELVRIASQMDSITVEITDKRKTTVARATNPDLEWLRDYQREAVDAVVKHTRGILWLPTASGKTEIAIGIVRSLPARWLFLVHRDTLQEQAAERFNLRGDEASLFDSTSNKSPWEGTSFVCATFQTLYVALQSGNQRAKELLQTAEGIIVDECHVLPADSFYDVVMGTPMARYRVGLSACPLARGDKRSILALAALGEVIYRLKTERLIAAGVVAKPYIRFVTVVQMGVRSGRKWQVLYHHGVVHSTVRNAALVDIIKGAEKPCIVFVHEIEHGRNLLHALIANGVEARHIEFAFGANDKRAKDKVLRRVEDGTLEVLICSVIFQEGIDLPSLRSVVVAAGLKSNIAAVQRIGRGMRRFARDGTVTKTEFNVWDVADIGMPMLERHTDDRRKAYEREGYEVIEEFVTQKQTRLRSK
jgi:superfamily II DNA or RNA helicase